MSRKWPLLLTMSFGAALFPNLNQMSMAADLLSSPQDCEGCDLPNVMSYTAQGTGAAKAVSGRFSLTADCKIGRMVDQSGRAFKFGRSPASALEAVASIDPPIHGPQDRRMSDAELASNYWNLCPVDELPSAAGEGSRGGGGGSLQGTRNDPSGPTTVASSPGPQPTRPVPIIVPGGGGGGGQPPGSHNVGVPFPVAGAGLPAILVAGAYALLRRRCRSRPN